MSQWEVVEGPRGGRRVYRLDPEPGGFSRVRVRELTPAPGERVLEAAASGKVRAFKVGPRGGLSPIPVTGRMRSTARAHREGLGTGGELARSKPGGQSQRKLGARLQRERKQPRELVERGLHGPGKDAAGYQAGGAGWGPARDMASRLGVDPARLRDVDGFSRLVESQLDKLAAGSFKLGNVFDDQEERTLVESCARLAERLQVKLGLDPPPEGPYAPGDPWLRPYVVMVNVVATNEAGSEREVNRANWVWAKDIEGMLLASIVGGVQVDTGWVTSKGSLRELPGEDPEQYMLADLQVRAEVWG